tara:strand:- start:2478 stop:2618 length:141 start_codon:yes stop_codon:yes gene_type:complete
MTIDELIDRKQMHPGYGEQEFAFVCGFNLGHLSQCFFFLFGEQDDE